ncbi:hypothetical protein B0H14DRAFT_3498655 [Mycena olivaceomarginata]|nr:hypothetical protein B0H14DRAFT_3498655 [Mycena olivaceomarginata]
MSRRIEKAATSSLVTSALDHSLLVIIQIGEATNLGVLKGASSGDVIFGLLIRVLDTCQTASGNKNEAMALVQDVGQLAMAVCSTVEELKDEIAADTELLDQISKLCLELEAVHTVVKVKLDSFGECGPLTNGSQDEVKLQRLQRDIKHAIDLFSFRLSVRLQRNISRSETLDAARKGRILDQISEVSQTVMDEIRQAEKQELPLLSKTAGPVLPRVPRNFFGREEPLSAVITAITASTPGRVAILGAAGIGKTSVASMVLFDPRVVEYFGDHRYFVSCDAAGGKDALLTAIAGSLGLQGDKLQKKIFEALGGSETPWDTGASSKKDVETFLASLCALDTLSVVITMRGSERPAGVQWSRPFLPQLGPLDVASARGAFLALSDCLEDDPWIDPSSLDTSIGISLNSRRMKAVPEALTLLSLISLLPDGVDNSELAAIFPSIDKSRRALSILWRTSLAYNDGHNRTRVLAPIRAHMILYHQSDSAHLVNLALDLTEEATVRPLLRGAIAAAIKLSKFIRYTYLGDPETVRLACVAAGKLGDPVLRADVLYHLAWISLIVTTNGPDWDPERLCREALALYEENENVLGRAECTWLLGQIHRATQRGKECKGLYEQALELAVRSQNTYCQAKCLSNLSEITFYGGDAKTAEELSQQALKLFRELEHLANIGMSLYMLARIAAFNYDRQADALFEEARVFLEQAGAHRQACQAIIGIGDCAFARCDFYTARDLYIKTINTLKKNGTLHSITGGYAQLSVGEAAACLYNYPEANHWLVEAKHTGEDILRRPRTNDF